MDKKLKDWWLLTNLSGVGPASVKQWLAHDYLPEHILAIEDAKQLTALGLNNEAIKQLQDYRKGRGALCVLLDKTEQWLEHPQHHLLSYDSNDYPVLLKEITDPPILLYVSGNLQALSLPQIAVVGSRRASRSGLKQAYDFSSALAQAGLVVTSGLATGIDASCHQGAVDSSRLTLAVLGTGIDIVYPHYHHNLVADILQNQGALISEYALGSQPRSYHFPKRNRIISGLSAGVLVVEAARRSGSLITARQALEQGREVFALPGAINSPQSQGCHQLIREGAYLVTEAAHIIEPLASLLGAYKDLASATLPPASQPVLSTEGQKLLDQISYTPSSIEQLLSLSNLSMARLLYLLTELELKGLIEQNAASCWRI